MPKEGPYVADLETWYLYPDGGVMTGPDRKVGEDNLRQRFGEVMPEIIKAEFANADGKLEIRWAANDDGGTVSMKKSDPDGKSSFESEGDLTTWNQFRNWAIGQKPRQHIFRGQGYPYKLASTFHRTWRKDLQKWIADDVQRLFGAVADRISYPLQLGTLAHNAAIWNILQHHGYPTPMLDWTFSPFVAAFFAFQHVQIGQDKPPRIFIFDQEAWNERYGKAAFIVDAAPPQMVILESMALGNPRSSPQQALSAVTNIADVEDFIKEREASDGVKYLTVCDLPASDRPRIMRELELMGLTYGSLFPGLDGICRDMKDRLFAAPIGQVG